MSQSEECFIKTNVPKRRMVYKVQYITFLSVISWSKGKCDGGYLGQWTDAGQLPDSAADK